MKKLEKCTSLSLFILLLVATSVARAQESVGPPTLPPEIGSTRDSTVAMDTDSGRKTITFLSGGMSDTDLAAIQRAAPNVRVITGLSRADALEIAPDVHGVDIRYMSPEFLRAAKNLRWVQALSAGVDRYLGIPELINNDDIVFTNMRGIHGATIADHVFAMLLTLTRDIKYYVDPMNRGTWNRNASGRERIALRGRTLFVVGLGGIGSEVAKRGKGFGMNVLATRRSNTPPPPYVDRQGKADDLQAFLKESDVVVLCVPLTDETRGMIGAEELALLKPGSYLVNIARGPVVDTDALVEALQSGHLAGACLDVTDPEPLPSDHVLWNLPDVVITPHVSSRSELTSDHRRALLIENLRRFGAGEPLLNVVNKRQGY